MISHSCGWTVLQFIAMWKNWVTRCFMPISESDMLFRIGHQLCWFHKHTVCMHITRVFSVLCLSHYTVMCTMKVYCVLFVQRRYIVHVCCFLKKFFEIKSLYIKGSWRFKENEDFDVNYWTWADSWTLCITIYYLLDICTCVGVCVMCRNVYVYEYDRFMYAYMRTYCIYMCVMTVYSAVRIPNCAI